MCNILSLEINILMLDIVNVMFNVYFMVLFKTMKEKSARENINLEMAW